MSRTIITAEIGFKNVTVSPQTTGTIYVASEGFVSRATDLYPNVYFEGRLDGEVGYKVKLSTGFWGGDSSVGVGAVEVINDDGGIDGWLNLEFRDKTIVLKEHVAGNSYDDATVLLNAIIERMDVVSEKRMRFVIRDPIAPLVKPMTTDVFSANDADGVLKPIAFGQPELCRPVLVDEDSLEYHVNDTTLQSIVAVYDQGVTVDFNPVANGFRLITAPSGKVTATVLSSGTGEDPTLTVSDTEYNISGEGRSIEMFDDGLSPEVSLDYATTDAIDASKASSAGGKWYFEMYIDSLNEPTSTLSPAVWDGVAFDVAVGIASAAISNPQTPKAAGFYMLSVGAQYAGSNIGAEYNTYINDTATDSIDYLVHNAVGETIGVKVDFDAMTIDFLRANSTFYDDSSPRSTLSGPYDLGSSLLTNLVSWWKMDETGGTDDRVDSYGSLDLTAYNTPTYITGKQGNAVEFTANNLENLSRTTGTSSSLGAGSRDFACAFWLKSGSLFGSNDMYCAGHASGTSTGDMDWGVYIDGSTDKITFRMDSASTIYELVSTNAYSEGQWAFIYIEYDYSTNTMGLSINNGTLDTMSGPGTPVANDGVFAVGRKPSSSSYMNGSIDELAFWGGRVLSSDEISSLYASGSGITLPGGGEGTYSPVITSSDKNKDAIATLRLIEDDFVYALPSGYSAWSTGVTADSTFSKFTESITDRLSGVTFDSTSVTAIDGLVHSSPETVYTYSYYLDKSYTASKLLTDCMTGIGGYWFVNRLGNVQVGQLTAPGTSVRTIDDVQILRDIEIRPDNAKGLSNGLGALRNWSPYRESEVSGSATEVFKQQITREYQSEYRSTTTMAGPYDHADGAPMPVSLLSSAAAASQEADRWAALYATARRFYDVQIALNSVDYSDILDEIGQTYTLKTDRYGLSDGLNAVLVGVDAQFLTNKLTLTLWGDAPVV